MFRAHTSGATVNCTCTIIIIVMYLLPPYLPAIIVMKVLSCFMQAPCCLFLFLLGMALVTSPSRTELTNQNATFSTEQKWKFYISVYYKPYIVSELVHNSGWRLMETSPTITLLILDWSTSCCVAALASVWVFGELDTPTQLSPLSPKHVSCNMPYQRNTMGWSKTSPGKQEMGRKWHLMSYSSHL